MMIIFDYLIGSLLFAAVLEHFSGNWDWRNVFAAAGVRTILCMLSDPSVYANFILLAADLCLAMFLVHSLHKVKLITAVMYSLAAHYLFYTIAQVVFRTAAQYFLFPAESPLLFVGKSIYYLLILYILSKYRKEIQKMSSEQTEAAIIIMAAGIVVSGLSVLFVRLGAGGSTFVIMELLVCFSGFLYIFLSYQRTKTAAEYKQDISYEELAETEQRMRQLKHDLKHYISSYQEIRSQTDESNEGIDQKVQQASSVIIPVITENAVVNLVMNQAMRRASENAIAFRYYIDVPDDFQMPEDDLYLLLSNLVDNAFSHLGSQKEIKIDMYPVRNMLLIRTENSVDAKDHTPSDTSHSEHGYGMKTIREITRKWDGILTSHVHDGIVQIQILLPLS